MKRWKKWLLRQPKGDQISRSCFMFCVRWESLMINSRGELLGFLAPNTTTDVSRTAAGHLFSRVSPPTEIKSRTCIDSFAARLKQCIMLCYKRGFYRNMTNSFSASTNRCLISLRPLYIMVTCTEYFVMYEYYYSKEKVEGVSLDTTKLLWFCWYKPKHRLWKKGGIFLTWEVAVNKLIKYREHNSVRYDCCWSSKHPQGWVLWEWLCIALVKQPWLKSQCFPRPTQRDSLNISHYVLIMLSSLWAFT